jgi:hypothetical protein
VNTVCRLRERKGRLRLRLGDCLSGFFRAEASPQPKAAVLLLHRSAASAHAHAHAHHDLDHIPIIHDHQPRAYHTYLPSCETGQVSHDITGDRIRSARQGQDLGDGAGSTCREKDTKKTGTTQACGSSSLPRTLTHNLSLLSQTETSELKRQALFLAGCETTVRFWLPQYKGFRALAVHYLLFTCILSSLLALRTSDPRAS